MRNQPLRPSTSPRGFAYWRPIVFMGCFFGLLVALSSVYLLPAMEAYHAGTPGERRQIDAYSSLLLAVVLLILLSGLVMTFRIGRFFFPRETPKRTKTQYVDAWSEAGKRLEVPPARGDDESEGDKREVKKP